MNYSKTYLKSIVYFFAILIFLCLGLVAYLLWLKPVFYFPKPTGKYTVGTKMYHWIDETRKDTSGEDPAHPYRELMVKIWYPAQGEIDKNPPSIYARDFFNYLKKNKP